jgi:hypothetical protein
MMTSPLPLCAEAVVIRWTTILRVVFPPERRWVVPFKGLIRDEVGKEMPILGIYLSFRDRPRAYPIPAF